jgi:tetratricopeptide (TPR) repeat protein
MTRLLVLVLLVLSAATTLLAQSNPYDITAQSDPSGLPTIEGEVQLPNGSPVPFIYLRLDPENFGGMIQSASTDSAGYYLFNGHFAGHNYYIDINVHGFEPIHRLVMVTSPDTEENFTLVPLPAASPSHEQPTVSVKELEISSKALAQYRRGLQHMNAGRYAKAEAAFHKAARLDSHFVEAFRQLSVVYAKLHLFSRARLAIEHAFLLKKHSARNFAYLGYLYMEEKHDGRAERAFQQCLGISKTDWFAHLELGRLRYNEHRYKDAYIHLLEARQLHPQIRSVHLLLYDDLIQLRKPRQALAVLTQFLARFPNCPQAAQLRKTRAALAASLASGE